MLVDFKRTKLMEFILYNSQSGNLPYNELSEAFCSFEFVEESYCAEGKIKRHLSGVNKYAEIKIIIEKKNNIWSNSELSWEVSNDEIPIEYLDVVTTTIKNICKKSTNSSKFRIIGGSFHLVDSSSVSFEIATFMAISNAIGFDNN
jgi:hypothetical protein